MEKKIDAKKEVFQCKQCGMSIQDGTLIRCPRCNTILITHNCTSCGRCR